MVDPLFWLGLSLLLVAVSLTAVLVVAIPAMRELGRAARSAEKLFDTLGRELPPTLEAIRLTGLEITELTDDMSEGVQNAGRIVQQVDQSVSSARRQAQNLNTGTKSFLAGAKAAWKTWSTPHPSSNRTTLKRSDQRPTPKPRPTATSDESGLHPPPRLKASQRQDADWGSPATSKSERSPEPTRPYPDASEASAQTNQSPTANQSLDDSVPSSSSASNPAHSAE